MFTDKRIIKTKRSIKNAFMTIITSKELSKITVSDIAEMAQINRSTFYLHYSDVNAVLEDMTEEISQKIASYIDKFDVATVYDSTYTILSDLSNFLDEQPVVKNFVLYSTYSRSLLDKVKEILSEQAINKFKLQRPLKTTNKVIYNITFLTSGIIDTYIKWSYSTNKDTPLDEICLIIAETADFLVNKITQ
jgi:AcrR family transcriptional regulator